MPEGENASPFRGRTKSVFRRFRDWGGKEFDRAALLAMAAGIESKVAFAAAAGP